MMVPMGAGSRAVLLGAIAVAGPGLEWSVHGDGGKMQVLVPHGCGPSSDDAPFAGIGGHVAYQHRDTETITFVVRGSLEARVAQLSPDEDAFFIGYGTGMVGWDGRVFGLHLGVYHGNVMEERDRLTFPAASLRFGDRDTGAFRLSLLDQPLCFPADCVLGFDVFTRKVSVGASLGEGAARYFGFVTVPDVMGDLDLQFGGFGRFLNSGDGRGHSFGLMLGIGQW